MRPPRNAKEFLTTQELKKNGISYYQINKMAQDGELVEISKNFYENPGYKGEPNDFYAVSAYSPKGVVCLRSAAVYYDLLSERPADIDVALPRRSRIPKSPDWPPMRFYLFSGERYSQGIRSIREEENEFQIYNVEKTVCDIVFYRNKLGFESAVEVVKQYLNRPERNINVLMEYARRLRVATAMRKFVEVLV